MKQYRVEISQTAIRDLEVIHDYIARDKPAAALQWLISMETACERLREMPDRHERIHEARGLAGEHRQAIVGDFRILYRELRRMPPS